MADPNFQTLQAELPDLRKPLERITSLTVGINLDVELRPQSAVLLSINDFKMNASASWVLRVMHKGRRRDWGLGSVTTKPIDADIPLVRRDLIVDHPVLVVPIPLGDHDVALSALRARRRGRQLAGGNAIGPVGEHLQ